MTAQRMQHTGASIVGRTAANSNDKIPAPLIQRMTNEFPHTVGCRFHWIARLCRNKRKPSGLCHLDHSCLIRQNSIGRLHRLTERTGIPVGTKLEPTVIEFVLKDSDMEVDPIVNHTHIYAMKAATPEEMEQITEMSLKIDEILTAYLKDISIELIDMKLEYGRYHGRIILADEITPDTARFWDASTHEPLDIDRFRRDMDNVAEAYQEVLHRMMGVS